MRKSYSKKQHGVRQLHRFFITPKATGALGGTSWFQERSLSRLCKPRCWSFPKEMDLALFEVCTRMLANLPCVTLQEESERARGFYVFSSLVFDLVWEKESKL